MPFQVRPRTGEGARSFLLRLAQANHLAPAYLRRFLAEPPLHRGSPSWSRIAAVTGRDAADLRRVLEALECLECGKPMHPKASFGVRPKTCSRACRQNRYLKGAVLKPRTMVPCRVCGKSMRAQLGQRRYMCSSHCRRIAYQFRQRGEPLPRPTNQEEASEQLDDVGLAPRCPACERPMQLRPGKQKACSRRCGSQMAWWTRHPLPPATTCKHCQQAMLPRSDGEIREWCSPTCRAQLRKQRERTERATVVSVKPPNAITREAILPSKPTQERAASSCRGCQQDYYPLITNPWCSNTCLELAILQAIDQRNCAGCGTSTADRRKTVPPRRWCSRYCRQRAVYWRGEFHDRAGRDLGQSPSPTADQG